MFFVKIAVAVAGGVLLAYYHLQLAKGLVFVLRKKAVWMLFILIASGYWGYQAYDDYQTDLRIRRQIAALQASEERKLAEKKAREQEFYNKRW